MDCETQRVFAKQLRPHKCANRANPIIRRATPGGKQDHGLTFPPELRDGKLSCLGLTPLVGKRRFATQRKCTLTPRQ